MAEAVNTYFAVVEKDAESAYGISFPDFPGCHAAADEESDIYAAAQTALALFIEDIDEMPNARTAIALQRDPDVKRDIRNGAFLIGIPLVQIERKMRYNVMLDRSLVREIDKAAGVSGISRSEFMATAIGDFLSSKTGAVVVAKAARRSRGKAA